MIVQFPGPAADLQGIVSATSSPRNLEAFARIDALRFLRPGWDGYTGVAPCDEARTQAKIFLANLPREICIPEIEPSGDGEINLVWRSADAYLEIGFTGAQHFSYFGKMRRGEPRPEFGDVNHTANRLPMALHAMMRRFVDDVRVRADLPERGSSLAWAS